VKLCFRRAYTFVVVAALLLPVSVPIFAVLVQMPRDRASFAILLAQPVPAVALRTASTSVVVTLISLPISLMIAILIRLAHGWLRITGLAACTAPASMNVLVTIISWLVIFERNGVVGSGMRILGCSDSLPPLLYRPEAGIVVLVYSVVPIMVLINYWGLSRVSPRLSETAVLLGARRVHVYSLELVSAIRPIALSGTVSFVSVVNLYLIPEFLSGPSAGQLGYLVQQKILTSYDPGSATVLSLLLLLISAIPVGLMLLIEKRMG